MRLRELRTERELTQQELANLAGLSPNYISDLETGNKRLGLAAAYKLSKVLGCTAEELMDEMVEG